MNDILLIFFSLLGVVGLIFLTFYGSKWMNKKFGIGSQKFGSGKSIRIKECVGVAPDKQLMIVSVGTKLLLIGVTPSGINKICDLDNEDAAAIESGYAASQEESGFLKNLKKAFSERQQSAAIRSNPERSVRREDNQEINDKDDF